MVGMIYEGDHQTLLYTKYISCGPYGYGIEVFLKVFPIISLCELLIPMCMASFHPRGFIGRIYVGATRHTKYISYNRMALAKIFLCFAHCKSMGVIDLQGVASLDSRGVIGRIYVVEH